MVKISFTNAQVRDSGYGLQVNGESLADIISMALGAKVKGVNYGDPDYPHKRGVSKKSPSFR